MANPFDNVFCLVDASIGTRSFFRHPSQQPIGGGGVAAAAGTAARVSKSPLADIANRGKREMNRQEREDNGTHQQQQQRQQCPPPLPPSPPPQARTTPPLVDNIIKHNMKPTSPLRSHQQQEQHQYHHRTNSAAAAAVAAGAGTTAIAMKKEVIDKFTSVQSQTFVSNMMSRYREYNAICNQNIEEKIKDRELLTENDVTMFRHTFFSTARKDIMESQLSLMPQSGTAAAAAAAPPTASPEIMKLRYSLVALFFDPSLSAAEFHNPATAAAGPADFGLFTSQLTQMLFEFVSSLIGYTGDETRVEEGVKSFFKRQRRRMRNVLDVIIRMGNGERVLLGESSNSNSSSNSMPATAAASSSSSSSDPPPPSPLLLLPSAMRYPEIVNGVFSPGQQQQQQYQQCNYAENSDMQLFYQITDTLSRLFQDSLNDSDKKREGEGAAAAPAGDDDSISYDDLVVAASAIQSGGQESSSSSSPPTVCSVVMPFFAKEYICFLRDYTLHRLTVEDSYKQVVMNPAFSSGNAAGPEVIMRKSAATAATKLYSRSSAVTSSFDCSISESENALADILRPNELCIALFALMVARTVRDDCIAYVYRYLKSKTFFYTLKQQFAWIRNFFFVSLVLY